MGDMFGAVWISKIIFVKIVEQNGKIKCQRDYNLKIKWIFQLVG